jgi:hypothetical protein
VLWDAMSRFSVWCWFLPCGGAESGSRVVVARMAAQARNTTMAIRHGAFNQFLRAGTPVISQFGSVVLPLIAWVTLTVYRANTNFVQGTTVLSPIPGLQSVLSRLRALPV